MAQLHAVRSTPAATGPVHRTTRGRGPRPLLPVLLVVALTGCPTTPEVLEVDLTTQRLSADEVGRWPRPAVESGQPTIVVRQVFTAQGPCRELSAELMRRFPGEFLLRVVAADRSPCPEDTPHIGYAAVLQGMPAGSHRLRVVHVGADGHRLAEAVLEHPIIVTERRPARDNR